MCFASELRVAEGAEYTGDTRPAANIASRFINIIENTDMKKAFSCILASMLLVVSCNALAAGEGDAAPAWQLQSIAGTELAFPQAAEGSLSVVLFWATWCPYCKAFMPYLDAIRQDYAGHDLRVFAINVKEDGDPVAFAKGHDYQFTYLLAGDDVAEQYAVRFVPGLFVVDGAGVIVFRRQSTDLPPGRKVAEFWDEQVRIALDESIGGSD